jgi:hypothetical protein
VLRAGFEGPGELLAAWRRRDSGQVVVELREMVQRVRESDESRSDRRQVGRLERERLEEVLDLLD